MNYNSMELMISCAARLLEDGKTVAVGTGAPCAAAMLAQRTGAPNLVILFEAGGIAPQLPTMPISVGDSRTFYRGLMATSNHDRRRFVEKLDFLTTPGYLTGCGAREAAGLPPGTGPYRVITDLAVLGYDEQTCRMQILSLHPGVHLQQVCDATAFELHVNDPIGTTLA